MGRERETVCYAPGVGRREATDLDHTVCVSLSVSGVRMSPKTVRNGPKRGYPHERTRGPKLPPRPARARPNLHSDA